MSMVTVIISNYQHKGNLLPCIRRALALDVPSGSLEVLFARHGEVVPADNRAMQELASGSAAFRLLPRLYVNRAQALNACAAAALGDVLLFLESHVLTPPSLAADYLHALADSRVAVIQGGFATGRTADWVSVVEDDLRTVARDRRRARGLPPDEFNIHSAVVRRHAFLTAGGFDERLPGMAEVLLFHRFHIAGRLGWLDQPVVEHINHASWSSYLGALEDRGREVALLRMSHPDDARRLYAIPLLDRNEARFRRWRWAMAGVTNLMWVAARGGCAAAHAAGLRSVERHAARRLAALAIRRGFLGTFR